MNGDHGLALLLKAGTRRGDLPKVLISLGRFAVQRVP